MSKDLHDRLMLNTLDFAPPINSQEICFTTQHGGVGFFVRTYCLATPRARTRFVVRSWQLRSSTARTSAAMSWAKSAWTRRTWNRKRRNSMKRLILSLWFLGVLMLSACSTLPADVSASVSPELRQQVEQHAAVMVAAFNERYDAQLSVPPIRYYNDASPDAACSFTLEDTAPAVMPASIPLTTNGKLGSTMHVKKPYNGSIVCSQRT